MAMIAISHSSPGDSPNAGNASCKRLFLWARVSGAGWGAQEMLETDDLTVLPNPGIIVNEGNHPQMGRKIQVSEIWSFTQKHVNLNNM